MRKRLVLFLVMLSSILCMIGCGNDPYKNMKLESASAGQEIQLNIKQENVGGDIVYSYDTYTFDVQVKDIGSSISPYISVSGGQDYVETELVYKGKGITSITVKPISHDKTGKFKLLVKTLEGNRSLSVDFNIDLKINSFMINDDQLKVVSKGNDVDLTDLDKYITFDPINTTQKDIKFEVVTPINGVIEGFADSVYLYDDLEASTYAVVEDNKLKTISGVQYPKKIESALVGSDSYTYTQCVTLKATYVGDDAYNLDEQGNIISKRIPDRFIDVEVVEDCSEVDLLMNFQVNNDTAYNGDGSSFVLEKNDDGEYDVTLLNPNYRAGVKYDTYYIERDLMFDFGVASESYNPNDYYVRTEPVLETANAPIVLSYSSIDNSFKVQSQRAGHYSHKFILDHQKYHGLIDREIIVNFHVLDLPTDIKVNNNVVQDEYKVYDYYPTSYGARFNIALNNSIGEYSYFVFADSDDIKGNLHLYKNDGTEQIMAVQKEVGGMNVIATENFSNFKNKETFYVRHSFDTLPTDDVYIYVGVKYSVASDSYSDLIKDNYFLTGYLQFPIKLVFENGVRDIVFTQSKYMVDTTNEIYNNGVEDYDGIKLFDLPKGQTFESVFGNNAFVYDHELIKVYSVYDEFEDITSVYMKTSGNYSVGSTDIVVTTKNGLTKSVKVETFVPTIYAENLVIADEMYNMPISMGFNEEMPLFYFTGKSEINPQEKFAVYKNSELGPELWDNTHSYNSLSKILLRMDTNLELRFYDYMLYLENGSRKLKSIDISDKVEVSFNYDNYIEYKNFKLVPKGVTKNINDPIIMSVSYIGGYMGTNSDGDPVYKTLKVTKRVEIYIYDVLQGVNIEYGKNNTLFVDNFLGYFDKQSGKSYYTVNPKFINGETIGKEWNDVWDTVVGADWWVEQAGIASKPIDIINDAQIMLDRIISDSRGEELVIRSFNGSETRKIKYGDLFEIENGSGYSFSVKSIISDDLFDWIREKCVRSDKDVDTFMRNNIFIKNITLTVNVFAKQFTRLQTVSSVKVKAQLNQKITNLDLTVENDGLYFEIGNGDQVKSIKYTIDNLLADNKELELINETNGVFTANVEKTATGGFIKVKAKGCGIEYLTVVPQDNIKAIDANGDYVYFDNSLVQQFRIKVADGSKEYPFEIKSVSDYERMLDNKIGYYILTRNINLDETKNRIVSFDDQKSKIFELNGAYTYYRNGVEFNVISKLYNLNINQTIDTNTDTYIGLFGNVTSNVIFRNLSIISARIDLTINNLGGKDLYVGILAGSADSSKVYNTQIIGSIKVVNKSKSDSNSTINIGGLFGSSKFVTIDGAPVTYQEGVQNTSYNANVAIDYSVLSTTIASNILDKYKYNIGGLIGADSAKSNINNQSIISTIKGINYNSSVGGVIGNTQSSILNKITVYPKIVIKDSLKDDNNVINVGGLVGSADPSDASNKILSLSDSQIYFTKEDSKMWQDHSAIMIESESVVNAGGMYGKVENITLETNYSYVRSLYNEDIVDSKYLGNLYIRAKCNIGGIAGLINAPIVTIYSIYFDGDITAIKDGSNMGALFGSFASSNASFTNSYAIAYMYDADSLNAIVGLDSNAGMIGNITLADVNRNESVFRDVLSATATLQSADLNKIDNVYSVINNNIYYFGENGKVMGLYEEGKTLVDMITGLTASNIASTLSALLGYDILLDSEIAEADSDDVWLWNKDVNIVSGIAFPVLLNKDKTLAMYDIIPEIIYVDRIDEDFGIYDISTNKETQILMFVNKNDTQIKDDYYEIAVDSENSAISIKFAGKTIVSRFFNVKSDLIFSEDMGGTIISLVGNRIYPINEGIAVLTIRSALDKTVKLNIRIKVVAGISDVQLYVYEDNKLFEVFETANVYIDEYSTFKMINHNVRDGINYNSPTTYGYQLTILPTDEGALAGKININGKEYSYNAGGVNKYLITDANLIVKGVTRGQVNIQFAPCILLNDIIYDTDYIVLDNLISDVYKIESLARARSIFIQKEFLQLSSIDNTFFDLVVETSNINVSDDAIEILSPLRVNVNQKDILILCNSTFEIDKGKSTADKFVLKFGYELDFELVRFRFTELYVQLTDVDAISSQNTYKLVFCITVDFNENYYRENANNIDLNTIDYDFAFSPDSNPILKDTINISFNPAKLESIFTNYYSKGELLIDRENHCYPEENESRFIIPGRSGLLKVTLDKEFSDSSYVEIVFKNSYQNYITLQQMSGVIETYISNPDDIETLTNNITSYTNLAFNEIFTRQDVYGIKLSKLTLNYNDKSYFNKTYFVKLDLDRNYGNLQEIEFDIVSYKVNNVGRAEESYRKTVKYSVTQLPMIDIKVDDTYSPNLGKGVKKLLDIQYTAVNTDIRVLIDPNGRIEDEKVFIVDENNIKVNNALSIDYLNSGKKYYICADVESDLVECDISFSVHEIVLGVREEAKSELTINVVDFEIEDVTISGAIDGVITRKHGQQLILATDIKIKDIVVGSNSAIEDYVNEIQNALSGKVSLTEYAIAGTTVTQSGTILCAGELNLAYATYEGIDKVYKPMDINSNFSYVSLIEGSSSDTSGYDYEYYVIKATSITPDNSPVELKLNYQYYYSDGELYIGNATNMSVESREIMFKIIVEDNSTYDHPNPVENAKQLADACKNGGEHILLNNIILENWKPIPAAFDSLDGNGYVITIKSFDLSTYRGGESANIGIFETISENSLLKNITIDVSELLKTEDAMLSHTKYVANSSKDNYKYDDDLLDLAYTNNVNFGILAGVNYGSITNAKVINTFNTYNTDKKQYVHLMTSQVMIDNNEAVTNIGGLVGVNESTGAITNSFVGLNISTIDNDNKSKIQIIESPSIALENNEGDYIKFEDKEIYPFIIAGGNNLGGLVSENNGTISNSYAKAVGLYNTCPAVTNSKTAGLVAVNNNVVISSFVESAKLDSYKAQRDDFIIESTGSIGGFVYENNSRIENSYVNACLETQSAFTGGFVFRNNKNGTITNVYTVSSNKNSLAHGQFTGVNIGGGVSSENENDEDAKVLNFGTYKNAYYVLSDKEIKNYDENATAILVSDDENDEGCKVNQESTWKGFSFAEDGIWTVSSDSMICPRIVTTLKDTFSFRELKGTEEETITDEETGEQIVQHRYDYEYMGNTLGSESNPLIIENSVNFRNYIIDLSIDIDIDKDGIYEHVFGASASSNANELASKNEVRYVRIVNNLNFVAGELSERYQNKYLYEIIFAGVLDGNGMLLDSLKLSVNLDNEAETFHTEDFGIFKQIGISNDISKNQAVIKNISINLKYYSSNSSSRAGVLAGTILNSNIINIKINGGSQDTSLIVAGSNMTGALAGLIYADEGRFISLSDITIEFINLKSSHNSLGGELVDDSVDKSNGFFKSFSVKPIGSSVTANVTRSFRSLYDLIENKTKLIVDNEIRTDVSYVGTVAGVIIANNYDTANKVNKDNNYETYRTPIGTNTIDNVVVKNNVSIIEADNSGGLFGYIGENTLVKNSKFVLNGAQMIQSRNYAGGIVAENHGVIESCTIAFDDKTQQKIDNNTTKNDRRTEGVPEYVLFDSTADSTNYSVAIGGIAGYSANGVIIDSYAKVNTTKTKAYIAGGVVGYSENYNYIAYTYSTGAVYGQFVIGGLVGMQVNTDDQRLTLYKDVSLADWNHQTTAYNYRQAITEKLYENQKILYENGLSYYNFYVKMPEIGNLAMEVKAKDVKNIEDADAKAEAEDKAKEDAEAKETLYQSSHNNFWVGSVVGKALINNPEEGNPYKLDESVGKFIDLSKSDVANKYAYSEESGVFSNTLGVHYPAGNLSAGKRQDTYFDSSNSTFDYAIASNVNIRLYSYRISYVPGVNEINAYEMEDIDESKPNDYFDIHSYSKVFTAQEYSQQILGTFTSISEETKLSQQTKNLFRYDYDSDNRYDSLARNENTAFVDIKSDNIWQFKKLLPEYNDGTYQSVKYITTGDELLSALSTNGTGITYIVYPNIAKDKLENGVEVTAEDCIISLDLTSKTNTPIAFNNVIRDIFIGESVNGIRTTIEIKMQAESNTLFAYLSGAVFQNLNISIETNMKVGGLLREDYIGEDYGIFANYAQNVQIIDTDITIKSNTKGIALEGDSDYHHHENVGLAFGTLDNSTVKNVNFYFDEFKTININNVNVRNLGMVAGKVNNSSIENTSCVNNLSGDNTLQNPSVVVDVCAEMLNYGNFVGLLQNSRFDSNGIVYSNANYKYCGIRVTGNNASNLINLSGMIGQSAGSTIKNINDSSSSSKLVVANEAYVGNPVINISNIVAQGYNTTFQDISLGNNGNELKIETASNPLPEVKVATIIAHDMGSNTLNNVESYNKIEVSTTSKVLIVGGLVGQTSRNDIIIQNSVGFVEHNIINNYSGFTSTIEGETVVSEWSENYIGGIIGQVNGPVTMTNVYSAGNINTNLAAADSLKARIGGIIGQANSYVTINTFAVLNNFVLADISGDITKFTEQVMVSGVVGEQNGGVFVGNYGYTYLELPNIDNIRTYAITNRSVGSSTVNVYYCQEFVGNRYNECDYNFRGFALADLYGTISEFSGIYELKQSNLMESYTIGKLEILIPKTCGIDIARIKDIARFNPKNISNTEEIKDNFNAGLVYGVFTSGYYVISNNTYILYSIDEIKAGVVISGRSLENGKVIVRAVGSENASQTSFAVKNNSGVISNVYFDTTFNYDENKGKNVALVQSNKGLITNVYAYGFTQNTYSLAFENNGRIYQSGSATIYISSNTNSTIYGLTNSNAGEIVDCYSGNFGVTKDPSEKTEVYGFAKNDASAWSKDETAKIYSSTYFIPEIMEYDNIIIKGVYSASGIQSNFYTSNENLLKRSNVWYMENGHPQIKGIKDIPGAIMIVPYVVKKDVSTEDSNFENYKTYADKFKNKFSEPIIGIDYRFDYDLEFYVDLTSLEDTKHIRYGEKIENIYNVVKIETSKELNDYFKSLNNGSLPEYTIVLLDNQESDGVFEWSYKSAFSIPATSMIVGIDGVKLDGSLPATTIKYSEQYHYDHELITSNHGFLANIVFDNFMFTNRTQTTYFAPILYNSGVIYKIRLNKILVGSYTSSVISLVLAENSDKGILQDCLINDYTITTDKEYSIFCIKYLEYDNIMHCIYYTGTITAGSIYVYGYNGYSPY